MIHDLSKLFSGQPAPRFELVLAKRGPFSGRRMSLAANDRTLERRPASLSIAEFAERNQVRFYKDAELAYLTGRSTKLVVDGQ